MGVQDIVALLFVALAAGYAGRWIWRRMTQRHGCACPHSQQSAASSRPTPPHSGSPPCSGPAPAHSGPPTIRRIPLVTLGRADDSTDGPSAT
jgi:hypothetical protein